jgi:Nif-specific regulatory protein
LASLHPSASRWIGALIRMSSPHPALTQILDVIERLQDHPYRTNALLLGEPGTGKEGLARALHHLMAPGTSLERLDLAGYSDEEALAALAAAGVNANRDDGVMMIEDTAGLSARVQTALLRLIKSGAGREPGQSARLNVIAISDRPLAAEVEAGRFRHDLYFTLARLVLTLPPLRERTQDLGPASVWIGNRILRAAGRDLELMGAEEFARATPEERATAIELNASAIRALEHHAWPGNFRELETVLERALMLYCTGASLGAREIELALPSAS